jgi:isochorismate hydrolase
MVSTDPADCLSPQDRAVLDATGPKPLPGLDVRPVRGAVPAVLAIHLQRHLFGDHVDVVDVVDAVAPQNGDAVRDRSSSSAFSGTDLLSRLVRARRDPVVALGCSASGCVRSTMLDAAQHEFAVLAPRECVFDRVQASTAIALLDASASFAEAASTGEVQRYLEEVAA